MAFCCEALELNCGRYQAPVGGGLYPSPMRPTAQIERSDDGSWNINGCCGGGCYVVTDIKFCPFCGHELAKLEDTK